MQASDRKEPERLYISRTVRKPAFCICEKTNQLLGNNTSEQNICSGHIANSPFFLNPKFQVSSHLLWLYSPVYVVRNLDDKLSHDAACIFLN